MAEFVRMAADAAALISAAASAPPAETCTVIMAASGHPANQSAATPFRTESCQQT